VASKRRTRTSVETHNHGAISPAGVARVVSGTYSDATDLGWTAADRPPAETESITNFGAGNIEVDSQRVLNPDRDRKSNSLIDDILRNLFD